MKSYHYITNSRHTHIHTHTHTHPHTHTHTHNNNNNNNAFFKTILIKTFSLALFVYI